MKKLHSLIKACMSSDMKLFKISSKNKNGRSNKFLLFFVAFCFMFSIWSYANMLFEKLAPMHLQFIVLSIFIFLTSILTIVQGIYKSGPLIFNCKDDQLLLSLPIQRRTVLFIRIFKFYVFELLFDTLFVVPLAVAYIRWADSFDWTFFLTSFVMLIMLPIIPIIISCIIGAISSGITSRFQHKNFVQISLSMLFLLIMFYFYSHVDDAFNYLVKHANSVYDLITKLYYPAGVYVRLVSDFQFFDLLLFVLVHVLAFTIAIFLLSKVYFRINSRLKQVTNHKKAKLGELKIRSRSVFHSFIRKEFSTFFNIPVFIINAGFGLVLFLVAVFSIAFRFDGVLSVLTDPNGMQMSKDFIISRMPVFIFLLIAATAYMTSITNSLISLEGKCISILKSLPVSTKTILMSKIYSSLLLTTPVLFIGDMVLFIRFRVSVVEAVLLLILSILVPLVSHFVGILVNLRYPKLDAENSTEVVKQSMSSFLSVMIGMVLLVVTAWSILEIVEFMSSLSILLLCTAIYSVVDCILYLFLIHKGVKEFEKLSV